MNIPDNSSKGVENEGIVSTESSFDYYYFLKQILLFLPGLIFAMYVPKSFSAPNNGSPKYHESEMVRQAKKQQKIHLLSICEFTIK